PTEGEGFAPGGRIPDLDRPVVTPGRNPPAGGVEGHGIDAGRMPTEGKRFLAAGRIPDLDRPVIAARNDVPAVGAERHAESLHPARKASVGADGEDLVARAGIPNLHPTVPAGGG